jgi:hypothetical protein
VVERLSGGQEVGGSIPPTPTNLFTCANCLKPLVGQDFVATHFTPDGKEYEERNTITPTPAGGVTVAVHTKCGGMRGSLGRRRKRRDSPRQPTPTIDPSAQAVERIYGEAGGEVRVRAGERTYTMADVRVISEGARVLMFMPRIPSGAELN